MSAPGDVGIALSEDSHVEPAKNTLSGGDQLESQADISPHTPWVIPNFSQCPPLREALCAGVIPFTKYLLCFAYSDHPFQNPASSSVRAGSGDWKFRGALPATFISSILIWLLYVWCLSGHIEPLSDSSKASHRRFREVPVAIEANTNI